MIPAAFWALSCASLAYAAYVAGWSTGFDAGERITRANRDDLARYMTETR